MTPFRFEHEFRGDADGYWRAFFDSELLEVQYERTGVRSFEILELIDTPESLTRSVRVVPARDLPAAIRRLTGASFGYTETTTFFKDAGYADTAVKTTTLANRIEIGGRHTVEATGPSRIVRVFEGTLSVDIKLLGKRIERAILLDMSESYAVSAQITQAWLDRQAGRPPHLASPLRDPGRSDE